jgi:hypothetical protein
MFLPDAKTGIALAPVGAAKMAERQKPQQLPDQNGKDTRC